MPEELENLIEIARIKCLAKNVGVIKIVEKGNNFVFYFNAKKFSADIAKLVDKYKNSILFSQAQNPYITFKVKEMDDKKKSEAVKQFLKDLK
jgi:transcription-repair coupling factor (superfamily II helicase)